jgi:TPR repeat protein
MAINKSSYVPFVLAGVALAGAIPFVLMKRPDPAPVDSEAPASVALAPVRSPPMAAAAPTTAPREGELPDQADWNGLDEAWVTAARARCEADYPAGCTEFASALLQQPEPEAVARAYALHSEVCDANAASYSCVVFARSLIGDGDNAAVLAILERACAANAPDACLERDALTGQIPPDPTIEELRAQWQVAFDEAQAAMRAEYDAACAAGDPTACYTAARLMLQDDDPASQQAALGMFERRCEADDAAACADLGVATLESDPVAAHAYFVRGCLLGNADACANRDLLDGNLPIEPTPEQRAAQNDEVRARGDAEYYASLEQRCAEGVLVACSQKAQLQLQGIGTVEDSDAAREQLERLCEAGEPSACYSMAVLESVAGPTADAQTLAYFRRACQLGSADGCREADALAQQ